MERSRLKTFKHQRTTQFIIAALVFNPLNSPARLAANQYNDFFFRSGENVRTIINCRVDIKTMVMVKALGTTDNMGESSNPFIPDFTTHLTCLVIYKSIPFIPNNDGRHRQILGRSYLRTIWQNLKMVVAG